MKVIETIVDLFYDDGPSFWFTIIALAIALILAHVLPTGVPIAAIFLPLALAATLVLYQRKSLAKATARK